VGKVFSNPGLAESLSNAGLSFVRRHFDWSVVGEQLNSALEAVVKK